MNDSITLFSRFGKSFLMMLLLLAPLAIMAQDRTEYEEEERPTELEKKIAEKRLGMLLSDSKSKDTGIKESKDDLTVKLQSVMTDNDNVYLKIYFDNDSRVDFEIDSVDFIYREPISLEKKKWRTKAVNPIAQKSLSEIVAKDGQYLGFCIPIYKLSSKGELIVAFVEKRSLRSVCMTIPYPKVRDSKQPN